MNIGSRVRLKPKWRGTFPKLAQKIGTVVGGSHYPGSVAVHWDGNKPGCRQAFASIYLEPLSPLDAESPLRVARHSRNASHHEETRPLRRRLFIVSRNHPDVLNMLRLALLNDPSVEVILDRRRAERRHKQSRVARDGRHADRRMPRTAIGFKERGWIVVSPAGHEGGAAGTR